MIGTVIGGIFIVAWAGYLVASYAYALGKRDGMRHAVEAHNVGEFPRAAERYGFRIKERKQRQAPAARESQ